MASKLALILINFRLFNLFIFENVVVTVVGILVVSSESKISVVIIVVVDLVVLVGVGVVVAVVLSSVVFVNFLR